MKRKILFIIAVIGIMAVSSGCEKENSNKYSKNTKSSSNASSVESENQSDNSSVSTSIIDESATQGSSETISEDEAKQIALDDAKVSASKVNNIRIQLKRDDGRLQYEVDFYVDDSEYEYEISALDGTILSMDTEIKNDFGSAASQNASVTISEAKKTALAKVPGATESDIHIHAEKDDGKIIYEGSIVYGDMEYEFKIDGETGKIWSWESESIYD